MPRSRVYVLLMCVDDLESDRDARLEPVVEQDGDRVDQVKTRRGIGDRDHHATGAIAAAARAITDERQQQTTGARK